MAKEKLTQNQKLFRQAERYLVGGVNSPVRSFSQVGASPLVIKRASGAKLYDYNGRRYIDYVLSWGASILGHADEQVVNEVKKALDSGFSPGLTSKPEIELARVICSAIPFARKIRFVNSGTEAVMGAIRLARGFTARDKIIKFTHSYHGHADYLLVHSGSGMSTLGIAQSEGVPRDFIKHTLVAPLGDRAYIEKLFRRESGRIAAVIVEPAGANYGVIPPDTAFLKGLRRLTREHGTLLIFDEVITGFRFHFGALSSKLDLEPDLICLGKIIGGGLPVGAYGGREEIMDKVSPRGGVYQASTFAGNPIVMQAGLATLKILREREEGYARIKKLAEELRAGVQREVRRRSCELEISSYENIFSFNMPDKKKFERFYRSMLQQGVFFAPSQREANFLSFAHTKRDIGRTLEALARSLDKRRHA